jgi:hypothetical protein
MIVRHICTLAAEGLVKYVYEYPVYPIYSISAFLYHTRPTHHLASFYRISRTSRCQKCFGLPGPSKGGKRRREVDPSRKEEAEKEQVAMDEGFAVRSLLLQGAMLWMQSHPEYSKHRSSVHRGVSHLSSPRDGKAPEA